MWRERIGTPGQLGCMAIVIAAAVLLPGARCVVALALALVLAACFHPGAFVVLRSRVVWTFMALVLGSGALWLGPSDRLLGAIPLSTSGALAGAWMAVRALAISLATRGLAAASSPGDLAGLLERAGLRGLGFTFGVAVNLLPSLERAAARTWDTLRMRGGLRHRRRMMARLALLTVMSNALRRADEIAIAAESRGFGTTRPCPLPLRRGAWDAPVLIAQGVTLAAVLVWR